MPSACAGAWSAARGWAESTPDGFQVYPKFPQEISHRLLPFGRVNEARALAGKFFGALEVMGTRLGCAFLQLPKDFAASGLANLRAFTEGWPAQVPLAIEFRSAYCFEDGHLRPEFEELLRTRGFGTVITDTPGRRDACHGTLTAPFVMVRFVGHELHETDDLRIEAWAERLLEWRSIGVSRVGFFIHQPEEQTSPELCDRLTRALYRAGLAGLTSWKDVEVPGQAALF